jgi:hypothetical protein
MKDLHERSFDLVSVGPVRVKGMSRHQDTGDVIHLMLICAKGTRFVKQHFMRHRHNQHPCLRWVSKHDSLFRHLHEEPLFNFFGDKEDMLVWDVRTQVGMTRGYCRLELLTSVRPARREIVALRQRQCQLEHLFMGEFCGCKRCAGYLVHQFRKKSFEKRETKEKRGGNVKCTVYRLWHQDESLTSETSRQRNEKKQPFRCNRELLTVKEGGGTTGKTSKQVIEASISV